MLTAKVRRHKGFANGFTIRPFRVFRGSQISMLTPLEKAVIDLMLDKPDEQFDVIRRQLIHAKIERRKLSGVGFSTDFIVPSESNVSRDLPNMEIGGIGAEFPTLKHGAGFVLFIRNGVVSMLEGFTYDEPWPENTDGFRLFRH